MNESAEKMKREDKLNDGPLEEKKVNEKRKSKQAIFSLSIANAMMEFC